MIKACRPWLDAELEVVAPKLIVGLGATAAQALLGSSFEVIKQRGGPAACKRAWPPSYRPCTRLQS
jgi:uracil-DNA glycosylase family 4